MPWNDEDILLELKNRPPLGAPGLENSDTETASKEDREGDTLYGKIPTVTRGLTI